MREKGFGLVSIVLIIAVVGSAGLLAYVYYPRPDSSELLNDTGQSTETTYDRGPDDSYSPSTSSGQVPTPSQVSVSQDPGLQYLKDKYNMTDYQLEILNTVNQEDNNL